MELCAAHPELEGAEEASRRISRKCSRASHDSSKPQELRLEGAAGPSPDWRVPVSSKSSDPPCWGRRCTSRLEGFEGESAFMMLSGSGQVHGCCDSAHSSFTRDLGDEATTQTLTLEPFMKLPNRLQLAIPSGQVWAEIGCKAPPRRCSSLPKGKQGRSRSQAPRRGPPPKKPLKAQGTVLAGSGLGSCALRWPAAPGGRPLKAKASFFMGSGGTPASPSVKPPRNGSFLSEVLHA